jgi:nitrogen fixation/metabolism regulation signal transduction histidine kinase
MGAWGAEIVHDVNREVGIIRRAIFLLRQHRDLDSGIFETLGEIDHAAEQLALPEFPIGVSGEGASAPFISTNLEIAIRSTMEEYRVTHPSIEWNYQPGDSDVMVSMHERFIHSTMQHLYRNAAFAVMRQEGKRIVNTRTFIEGSMAVVEVEDTGKGLRPELIPMLFRQPIPHEDGRKGRGLLLVGFILAQHGARIELIPNSKTGKGTLFRLWLPIPPQKPQY